MWKNKKLFVLLVIFLGLGILLLSQPAWAGAISDKVNQFGKQVYGETTKTDVVAVAAGVIRALLGLLGLLAVALIMYGGFIYMTSQGETEKIKKAKNTLIYASVGLLIILTAYTIATFVFDAVLTGTGGGGSPDSDYTPPDTFCDPCTASCPGETCPEGGPGTE